MRRVRRTSAVGRSIRLSVLAVIGALALSGCTAAAPEPSPSASAAPSGAGTSGDPAEIAAIQDAVQRVIDEQHVRAAIVRVTRGDEVVLMQAWGESMSGVPATTDMHFRSGAVSIPQVSTVLLQLVDEGTVTIDDTLATWLPDVPNADRVTLGQLAQMTSGYADYVQSTEFVTAFLSDPFQQWTPEELYPFGTDQPLFYEPGTNWDYAHTNYVLLGLAIEQITGKPLAEVLRERVLDPLGMTETDDPGTPEIQQPVLHAYDSERRELLGVAAGVRFIEDSTYWNPSWSLARGAVQNTDVTDMATVMRAIGRGDLLSEESHALQIAPTLRGKTSAVDGCPTCAPMTEGYTYGYGIVLQGDWLTQNPLFHGFGGMVGYLAADDLVISVAATYEEEAFDPATGGPDGNLAVSVFTAVAAVVAPDSPLPQR